MLDLDRLLMLRLVVARFGEMDLSKWWNTKGQLGRLGSMALRRGFPRTHHFAQARSVFAVASRRCTEVFDPPNSVTLWRLPEGIEEAFDARWEHWVDNASEWGTTFARLETMASTDLPSVLQEFDLIAAADIAELGRFKLSAEGRAIQIPGTFNGSLSDIALLASAFSRADMGQLAVPYMELPRS